MSTALYFIIWRLIFSIGIQNSWRSWNNAGRNEDECVKTKMTALKRGQRNNLRDFIFKHII
jgi:hypothetical protein